MFLSFFFLRLWQPSLVVSQQALNGFLSRPIDKRAGGSNDHIDETGSPNNCHTSLNGLRNNGGERSMRRLTSFIEGEISIEEILCPHGGLDPAKATDMKRIDRVRLNRQAIKTF